jgi:hypothetical protein
MSNNSQRTRVLRILTKPRTVLNSTSYPWDLLAIEYSWYGSCLYIADPYAPTGTYWHEHRALQA